MGRVSAVPEMPSRRNLSYFSASLNGLNLFSSHTFHDSTWKFQILPLLELSFMISAVNLAKPTSYPRPHPEYCADLNISPHEPDSFKLLNSALQKIPGHKRPLVLPPKQFLLLSETWLAVFTVCNLISTNALLKSQQKHLFFSSPLSYFRLSLSGINTSFRPVPKASKAHGQTQL